MSAEYLAVDRNDPDMRPFIDKVRTKIDRRMAEMSTDGMFPSTDIERDLVFCYMREDDHTIVDVAVYEDAAPACLLVVTDDLDDGMEVWRALGPWREWDLAGPYEGFTVTAVLYVRGEA